MCYHLSPVARTPLTERDLLYFQVRIHGIMRPGECQAADMHIITSEVEKQRDTLRRRSGRNDEYTTN
jgi:hypothetical protein